MKKLFAIAILMIISFAIFAQAPPRIRIPGSKTLPEGIFKQNMNFEKNKRYYSADKRYCMVFQEDGNLVMYKFTTPTKFKAIWYSKTNGLAIKSCIFQEDGNLVLYDYAGKARWAANGGSSEKGGTFSGDKFFATGPDTHWLAIQDDGNLVIYYGKYPAITKVRWSSNSFEKN